MAQRSRFFDSTAGDRIYTSAAFAEVFRGLVGDGIVNIGDLLAVLEASPPSMNVRVNTGVMFVRGYYFEVHTGMETLAIAAANPTNPRIDRVVVRRSLSARSVVLAVLTGTPAASPTAPALTQVEAGVYELSLAQVLVGAGATSIVNANITMEGAYASSVLSAGAEVVPGIIGSVAVGTQNNFAPTGITTARVIRMAGGAATTISGISAGQVNGRVLAFVNAGTINNVITFPFESGSSTAANRIAGFGNITVGPGESVSFIYDGTSQRWRYFGGVAP